MEPFECGKLSNIYTGYLYIYMQVSGTCMIQEKNSHWSRMSAKMPHWFVKSQYENFQF